MNRTRGQSGYTLAELIAVLTVIALIAAVATPVFSSNDEARLELAAADVAGAIRFTRSEAMRTGEGRGITVSQATQKVTVRKYDLTTAPISALETLIHPIDKQPYDFNVNTNPATKGVTISNSEDAFDYRDIGRRRSLIFDANGTPLWIIGSGPTSHMLSDGTVELSYGQDQRRVIVAPITGRVTIQ